MMDNIMFLRNFRFSQRSLLKLKGKAIPLEAWTGPEGSRRLRNMKVVRLSALSAGPPLTPRKYSWYSFLLEA